MNIILNCIYLLKLFGIFTIYLIAKEAIENKKLKSSLHETKDEEILQIEETQRVIRPVINLYNIDRKMLIVNSIVYVSATVTMVMLLTGYGKLIGTGEYESAAENLVISLIYAGGIYIYRNEFVKSKTTLLLINDELDILCESMGCDISEIEKIKDLKKITEKKVEIILKEKEKLECCLEENTGS